MKKKINWVIQRAVLIYKTTKLIVEHLDFRNPNLS